MVNFSSKYETFVKCCMIFNDSSQDGAELDTEIETVGLRGAAIVLRIRSTPSIIALIQL